MELVTDAVYAIEHSIDGLGGLQALHGAKIYSNNGGLHTCFLVLKVGGARSKEYYFSFCLPFFTMCTDLGRACL